MTHEDQHTDVLDFPGAAALQRAGRTEPLDPAVQARARSLVLGAIAADAAETVPAAVVKPRFGRGRVFALAAAVAAIAVGAAVLPVTDMGGSGPAAGASAAEVFTSMAEHTTLTDAYDAQTLTEAYWKTRVRSWVEGGKGNTADIYQSRTKTVIKVANQKTTVKSHPEGFSWQVGDGQVAWQDINTLPTRPNALRGVLSAGAKGSAAEQTVRQAGVLLTRAPVSPRLRAALYRVLADTPGAVVTEGVKDGVGRTGTQISWKWTEKYPAHSDHNPNWIVRPSDGRLLEVNSMPGGQDGHIVQRATYLSAGPAKTTG
ncbi:hypothetical protein JGS39_28600 [Streptomyces sp. P01-B04]|uniref:hypothetical protein n=1 Tax=Streptomyces poriferorum TaxID=2798799 RepID=UPI001C5F7230|nr:hypothetical protein [Streptomyces poriferorum]MBW5252892.1 hypothetical protein [Streptomyces poriferorum]